MIVTHLRGAMKFARGDGRYATSRIDRSMAAVSMAIALLTLFTNVGFAQVVQLPTVRNFSVTGGASVPDGGTALLGSSGYSATSSTTRGPFPLGSRAIGGISAGASMTASVQIIDLDALDEALLGRATNTASSAGDMAGSTAANLADERAKQSNNAKGSAGPLDPQDAARDRLSNANSLLSNSKQVRARRVTSDHWARVLSSEDPLGYRSDPTLAPPNLKDSNIRHFLELGRAAEQAGRINAANVHYRMALEAMSPELKQRYQRALERQAAEVERQRAAISKTTNGSKP